tara:strand:- start:578 stop:1228 length:651 start_codon:yes stop_codon:yes gene_type:complete
MERFPNIEMSESEQTTEETHELDIKADLAVIEAEDLKSDPFIRAKPHIPPPPEVVDAPKKKRNVSEKQKTHLANMRKLAKEKREAKKLELLEFTNRNKPEQPEHPIQTEMSNTNRNTQPQIDQQIDGFDTFLGYMEKFQDIHLQQQQEEQKRREEAERKEIEMEAKYFKRFQEREVNKKKSLPVKSVPSQKKIPQVSVDILNQKEDTDYGIYSNYF